MKIRPVGAELIHAKKTEGPADMTKLIIAFWNLANPPKHANPSRRGTED
jgi:hypothetical protein